MSLFASLGQGDIWALSGISFASPINDLLDKGNYTLEELLEEDELIQEVKSKNERLIEFLSTEESVGRLLDFITTPAVPVESPSRVYKFPYMSCEVICCEIPELLKQLIEGSDGKFLQKLFNFLSTPNKLDYYLAGYFEKILEMLFRRVTIPMMRYFNDSGSTLLVRFLDHMDNYSVMQIVQRLMLPHIPFSNLNDGDGANPEEDREQQQCNWSYQEESCRLLFNRMFDNADADVPLHISDLLITVLQLSPPETFVIQFLCRSDCIQMLLKAAVEDGSDMEYPGDEFTVNGSVSLAAISVLESLSSRLFESSIPFEQNQICDDDADTTDQTLHVKKKIEEICSELVPFIPMINRALQNYISNNPCSPIKNQSKSESTRLGHRGLQLVKLIESVVRFGSVDVDSSLCSSGTLQTCLQLFFKFVNNSLLHLSVQRIVLSILESDTTRSKLQQHLLQDCQLVTMIISKMHFYHGDGSKDSETVSADLTAEEQNAPICAQHSSIAGNLVLIAQALSLALELDEEGDEKEDDRVEINHEDKTATAVVVPIGDFETPQIISTVEKDDEILSPTTSAASASLSDSAAGNKNTNSEDAAKVDANDCSSEKPSNLRSVVTDSQLLNQWDEFVQSVLRVVLDHQIVGSYQAPTSLGVLSASQDDPLKLGVDLDLFQLESGSGSMDEDDDEDIIVGSNTSITWERNKNPQTFVKDDPFEDVEPSSALSSATTENFSSDSFNAPPGESGMINGFADFATFGASNASGASFESAIHDDGGTFADFADFDSANFATAVNSQFESLSIEDSGCNRDEEDRS